MWLLYAHEKYSVQMGGTRKTLSDDLDSVQTGGSRKTLTV
jgi:hypothetical protein